MTNKFATVEALNNLPMKIFILAVLCSLLVGCSGELLFNSEFGLFNSEFGLFNDSLTFSQ
jgi:hypothetical protein